MKRPISRFVLAIVTLAALAFSTGCAEFAAGFSQVANETQQQQQQSAANDPYYHQRANTSAAGIK